MISLPLADYSALAEIQFVFVIPRKEKRRQITKKLKLIKQTSKKLIKRVRSCFHWLNAQCNKQNKPTKKQSNKQKKGRQKHIGIVHKEIKASEMLVAPQISECFGLGLL